MNNLPTLSKHATVLNLVLTVFLLGSLLITAFTINSVRSLQPEAAKPTPQYGTVTLTNGPIHYHQVAQFSYTLLKRPRWPNFVVTCLQNNKRVFIAEGVYFQLSNTLQGSISFLMANESHTYGQVGEIGGYPGLDYTITADCSAYLLDEGSPNGKPTTFNTNPVGFMVYP